MTTDQTADVVMTPDEIEDAMTVVRNTLATADARRAGHLRLRTDGRNEVADHAEANDRYGCTLDHWCILADGHTGGCDDDREDWPGPGVLYPVGTPPASE